MVSGRVASLWDFCKMLNATSFSRQKTSKGAFTIAMNEGGEWKTAASDESFNRVLDLVICVNEQLSDHHIDSLIYDIEDK